MNEGFLGVVRLISVALQNVSFAVLIGAMLSGHVVVATRVAMVVGRQSATPDDHEDFGISCIAFELFGFLGSLRANE